MKQAMNHDTNPSKDGCARQTSGAPSPRSGRRTLLKAALGTAFAGAAGIGAASLWLQRADERRGLREFASADLAFGTTVSLKVLHEDEASARRAMRAALCW